MIIAHHTHAISQRSKGCRKTATSSQDSGMPKDSITITREGPLSHAVQGATGFGIGGAATGLLAGPALGAALGARSGFTGHKVADIILGGLAGAVVGPAVLGLSGALLGAGIGASTSALFGT